MSLLKDFRFKVLKKFLSSSRINILDVGCGNHSPSITKKWFSQSKYYGIDISSNCNNDEADINLIDKFYSMDLTKLDFHEIPDNYFDAIIMSQIIEHLHNGDKVIEGLINKMKPDGLIYIEYPSQKSLALPSCRESLNFSDDSSHCRIYSIKEIANLLMRNGCKIIKGGTRRDTIKIITIPLFIVKSLISKRYISGGIFWDILGFAEFVIAKKR